MRAAVYVRVSTEDQARHGYSLAEQEETCRRRAAELGAAEVLLYRDEGVSGASLDRPGLAGLREAARAGRVDVLVCRDPDRLSRRLAHQLLLTEEFEKAGVRLEFLDFAWQESPEGRLFYSIRGAIAEYEREKIRDRMARGKLQKARQGGIPVGFYAYGYRYDPETERVEVLEDEAVWVRRMFEWFVSEDVGVLGVANRLTDAGAPTRKGKPFWRRQTVRQILANPVYKGEWRYRDLTVPVPAIVDAALWERAQDKLKEARRLWAGKGRKQYLLSGILTCADCGNPMVGTYTKWWGRKERRYTCRQARGVARNLGCRPAKSVPAGPVERAVWEQVKAALSDPDALAREAAARSPQAEELRREMGRVEKLLADAEKGREAVLDALAAGLVELDARTKARLAELKRRKERLEVRKRELEALLRGAEGAAARLDELRALAAEVLGRLDELSFEEKRALVRAVVAQVTVGGRGVRGAAGLRTLSVTVALWVPEPGSTGVMACQE